VCRRHAARRGSDRHLKHSGGLDHAAREPGRPLPVLIGKPVHDEDFDEGWILPGVNTGGQPTKRGEDEQEVEPAAEFMMERPRPSVFDASQNAGNRRDKP